MRRHTKDTIEPFTDLICELMDLNLNFEEAFVLDPKYSDQLDCVNQLIFKNNNETTSLEEVEAIVKKYEDPYEFAEFKVIRVDDLYIIFAYI